MIYSYFAKHSKTLTFLKSNINFYVVAQIHFLVYCNLFANIDAYIYISIKWAITVKNKGSQDVPRAHDLLVLELLHSLTCTTLLFWYDDSIVMIQKINQSPIQIW